jgi:hypothetical protein
MDTCNTPWTRSRRKDLSMYTVCVPFSLHSAMPSMRPGSLYACITRKTAAFQWRAEAVWCRSMTVNIYTRPRRSCPKPPVNTCLNMTANSTLCCR